MLDRFIATVSRLLLGAAALALALMMGILCWQVFARYVLNASPPWAEQTALLLMVWMTFLGTAAGIADGFHIRIAEGVNSLPARWQIPALQIANCLIVLCGLLMLVFGTVLVAETWGNAVPTLPLTRGQVYCVIPVCGGLMALFALHHLLQKEATGGSIGSA